MSDTSCTPPRVEYYPPSDAVITDYANAVCTQLGDEDPAFNSIEVRSGFTEFLKVLARILAAQRTRQAAALPDLDQKEAPDTLTEALPIFID